MEHAALVAAPRQRLPPIALQPGRPITGDPAQRTQHQPGLLRTREITPDDVLAHTDTSGSPQYNQNLSDRRATAVAAFLSRHGVARARIASKGLGESAPLYNPEANETERAANRRVEIRLVPYRSTDGRR